MVGRDASDKAEFIAAMCGDADVELDTSVVITGVPAVRLKRRGLGLIELIDTPDLTVATVAAVSTSAHTCDAVVALVHAIDGPRELERRVITQIGRSDGAAPRRHEPPSVVVLGHVEQLRPASEWSPPFDLNSHDRPIVQRLRAAVEATAKEFDIAIDRVIPVSFYSAPYNIDVVWARIATDVPAAQRARNGQKALQAHPRVNWSQLWKQARNAGRVVGRTLRKQ